MHVDWKNNGKKMVANALRFAKSANIFFRERFPIYGTSEVCCSTSLWSHSQSHSHSASLLPSTAMLQQTASTSVLHHQQVRPSQYNARFYSPILPSQMTWTSHQVPNTNPFYLKFITGNIRMCQGCRSILR